jgi:transcriptional regulator with XRE-family HTH domain
MINQPVSSQRRGSTVMPKRRSDKRDIEVGRRLRTYRLQRGLSQEKLADQLGVTFQQVQKYEKGTNRISAGRLQRISEVLDVPITEFFTVQRGGGAGQSEIFELLDTAAALRLVRAYSRIRDPKVQQALLYFVEQVAAAT